MKEKELALFLYDVGIILNGYDVLYLDEEIVDIINSFILECYKSNRDSLKIICSNFEKIDFLIHRELPIIRIELVIYLIRKYYNDASFLELLDSIGPEEGQQISEFALDCVKYRDALRKRKKHIPPTVPTIPS